MRSKRTRRLRNNKVAHFFPNRFVEGSKPAGQQAPRKVFFLRIPTSNPNIITPVGPQICFLLNSIAQIKDGDPGIFIVTMVSHQAHHKTRRFLDSFLIALECIDREHFGSFGYTVPNPILDSAVGGQDFPSFVACPPEASAGKPEFQGAKFMYRLKQ